MTSHSGIGLSSGSPVYNTHTGHSNSGRTVTASHSGGSAGNGATHTNAHASPSMHHQALQSDFQPPYFPPPFHHTTQSPPQQQNHGIEYLGADPYGQPLSSLHHAPLHHYNQLTGLRPTQDQLGIHRSHREAELQGHVVSEKKIIFFIIYMLNERGLF